MHRLQSNSLTFFIVEYILKTPVIKLNSYSNLEGIYLWKILKKNY